MTKKLTKSEKAARLDAFLSDDDNFVAVEYNDPRAVALRAKSADLNARKEAARAARTSATEYIATSFRIGQILRTRRGERGEVVAIDKQNISISVNGTVREFNAAFLTVA